MIKKMIKIAICGYYGRGNLGDEAILQAITKQIKKKNTRTDVQVLTNKNLLTNAQKMLGADFFIFGGGSILQNATSDASLFYYLTIIRIANLLCKRKIMLANGIGPIIEHKIPLKILLRTIARSLNCFDFISVRDTQSQKLLQNLLPNRKIHLIPDPALIEFTNINQRLMAFSMSDENNNFFAFCPYARSLESNKIHPDTLAKSFTVLSEQYKVRPKIVVFNEKEDLQIARVLKNRLKNAEIVVPHTAYEAARAFHHAKFVISSRYHASLLAISLGIPMLSVSADPKIIALANDFCSFPALSPSIFRNSELLSLKTLEMITHHSENKDIIAQKIALSTRECEISIDKILK